MAAWPRAQQETNNRREIEDRQRPSWQRGVGRVDPATVCAGLLLRAGFQCPQLTWAFSIEEARSGGNLASKRFTDRREQRRAWVEGKGATGSLD